MSSFICTVNGFFAPRFYVLFGFNERGNVDDSIKFRFYPAKVIAGDETQLKAVVTAFVAFQYNVAVAGNGDEYKQAF